MRRTSIMIAAIVMIFGIILGTAGNKVWAEENTASSEKTVLDPFDEQFFNSEGSGVWLQYEGYAPAAVLTVRNTIDPANPLSKVEYTSDRKMGINNGDQITITASLPEALKGQYSLKETSKTITCEGLGYYVQSPEDISDDCRLQIDEEFRSHVDEAIGNYKTTEILEITPVDEFMFVAKDHSGRIQNRLIRSYRVSWHFYVEYWYDDIIELYEYIDVSNIVKMPDGRCTCNLAEGTTGFKDKENAELINPYPITNGGFAYGYNSKETIFSQKMDAYQGNYEYKAGVVR